jgi:general secretion pathway protein C
MTARLSAFVMWALVAAGLVFWGYRLWANPTPIPANAQTVGEGLGMRGDLTRLLGAAAVVEKVERPVAVESTRFRLFGVLAPRPASGSARPSTGGVALIAVDGKPARAYAVGARLDGDLVLQSIARRSASIGPAQGAATIVLELQPPPEPATGTLPSAVADGDAAHAPQNAAMQAPPRQVSSVQPHQQPQQQPPQQQPQQQIEEEAADDEEAVTPPRRGMPQSPAMR